MEDNKDFISTEQTPANDYTTTQMCYVPQDPVYSPIESDDFTSYDAPETIRDIYNTKLNEINNDVEDAIYSYDDITNLNERFDYVADQLATNQSYATITDLVEMGFPASQAVELFRKQSDYKQSYGSGLYTALAETRMMCQANDNPILGASYTNPQDQTASLYESMQNVMANYQMLDDMVTKAIEKDNERGILTKAAVGLVSGAALPFEYNWNSARKFKNIIKKRLGNNKEVQEIGDSWSMNDVTTAARKALMREATGSINNFKQLLNDIDQDLLEDNFLTLGDRSTFWSQVWNTTYGLNRFAFGAELVGVLPVLKAGATAVKGGVMATGSIAKGVASGALKATVSATGLDSFAAISKVAKKPISLLRMVGKTKDAKEIVQPLLEVAQKERVINPDAYSSNLKNASRAFLEECMPGAYNPQALKSPNSVSIDAVTAFADTLDEYDLKDAQEAIGLAREVTNTPMHKLRMETQGELMTDFANRYLSKQMKKTPTLENVNMITKDDGYTLYSYVGIGDDYRQPFASVKDAQDFADKINSNGGVYNGLLVRDNASVEATSAGAFVKVERQYLNGDTVANLGDIVSAAVKESKHAKNTGRQFSKSWLGRFFYGANITSDFFTSRLNDLKQSSEGRIFRLISPHFKKVDKLSSSDKLILDSLQYETARQGAYFTTSILKSKGIPENVIEAYRSMKIMSDASQLLRMKETGEGMVANNVKNIRFKDVRMGLGQQIDRPTDRKTIRLVTGYKKTEDGLKFDYQDVDMSSLKSVDTKFVRLTNNLDGDNVVAIRTPNFSYTDPSIMDTAFSYKPGRMVFTQGTGFVKQPIIKMVEGPDGEMREVVTGVRTVFAHPVASKVEEAANIYEAFRQEAIKVSQGKSLIEAQRDIEKIKGWEKVGSFDKFYKLTQGDDPFITLAPESKLTFARDGEEIFYKGKPVDFNYKGMSVSQYTNSEKVLVHKMRGDSEILNPFNFDEAPRLNAMQEMTLASQNMLRYSSIDDYTKLYADNFMSSFRDYINNNDSAIHNLLYYNPDSNKTLSFDVKQRIKNAQSNYKRMMSTATEFDTWMESMFTKLADKLVPDLKDATPDRLAWYDKLSKGNPVKKAKAWTFNWYLSMFNPKQLITQAVASLNAIEMEPTLGGFALKYHFPIMSYLNSGDAGVLKKAAKLFGGKFEDLKEVAEITRKLDVYSQAAPGGLFELGTKEASLGGSSWWDPASFYLKGEYANRTYTAIMAAKEAFDKGARNATIKFADVANITTRQQNFYMNMGRAGTSQIQTGFWGFLTQFKGYPMRFVESLATNKELSFGEKSKLFLLHSVFGGMKGMLGGKAANKIYSFFSDKTNERTPFEELSYHGMVDYLAMQMGVNKSFGALWSVSLGDLFDMAMDTTLADMAPFTTMVSKPVGFAATTISEFRQHLGLQPDERSMKAFWSGYVTRLTSEKTLPGGMNNLLAGWYALKTGERLNKNGQLTAEGQDALDAFLTAVGFKDISEDQMSLIFAENEKFKSDEKEQEAFTNKLFAYHFNAPNQEESNMRAQQVRNQIAMIASDDLEFANRLIKKVYSNENMQRLTTEQKIQILQSMSQSYPRFKKDFQKMIDEARERAATMEQ